MKKILFIEDSMENKITYYHLLLFVITLPFDRFYSQLFLLSLFLHTCIHLRKEKFSNLPWKAILLLQSVYLLTMAGTLYTSHSSIAFGFWEKQLAILIFPLIFFLSNLDIKKYTPGLLYAFAIVNATQIIYLYVDAFRIIHYYDMPLKNIFSGYFFSHKFSAPVDIHATYLSLYAAISLVVVLSFFILKKRTKKEIIPALIIAAILSLGLLQLGSRGVITGLLLVLFLVFPFFISDRKKKWLYLGTGILVTSLITIFIINQQGLEYRYIKSLSTDLGLTSENFSISDPRSVRWSLAWELVRDKPLTGHGSGDEVPLLKEKYFSNQLYDSYLHGLNAHNQYLSFLIRGGLPALLLFLFTLYYFARLAIKSRNLYFQAFLALLIVVSFSENLLNVNKGIFFYAFFLSLFAYGELRKLPSIKLRKEHSNPGSKKNVFINEEITV